MLIHFLMLQDMTKPIKQTKERKKDAEEGKKRTRRTVKDFVSDLLRFFVFQNQINFNFCCFLHYTKSKIFVVVFLSFFGEAGFANHLQESARDIDAAGE